MIGLGIRLTEDSAPAGGFWSSHPIALTRSSQAWAQDSVGAVSAFAPGMARLTNRGLTLGADATRLHGECPANRRSSAATFTALPAEGLFSPVEITADSANTDRCEIINVSVTSGATYHFRARYRLGSSGHVALRSYDGASDVTIADPTGPQTQGGLAIKTRLVLPNGDVELVGTWTASTSSSFATLGLGPNVAYQSVILLGLQVTSAYSDWIFGGGASSVSVTADTLQLDLTGVDMSSGFLLRIDGQMETLQPTASGACFYGADDGTFTNRMLGNHQRNHSGRVILESYQSGVFQGAPILAPSAALGPFSLVVGHGPNHIGGAWNGVVATPDTVAAYVPPTRLKIGGSAHSTADNLPLLVTRIALYPEAPTTARIAVLAT